MKAAKKKPLVRHALSPVVVAWVGPSTCCGRPVVSGDAPRRVWLATTTEISAVTCTACKRRIAAAPQLRNALVSAGKDAQR